MRNFFSEPVLSDETLKAIDEQVDFSVKATAVRNHFPRKIRSAVTAYQEEAQSLIEKTKGRTAINDASFDSEDILSGSFRPKKTDDQHRAEDVLSDLNSLPPTISDSTFYYGIQRVVIKLVLSSSSPLVRKIRKEVIAFFELEDDKGIVRDDSKDEKNRPYARKTVKLALLRIARQLRLEFYRERDKYIKNPDHIGSTCGALSGAIEEYRDQYQQSHRGFFAHFFHGARGLKRADDLQRLINAELFDADKLIKAVLIIPKNSKLRSMMVAALCKELLGLEESRLFSVKQQGGRLLAAYCRWHDHQQKLAEAQKTETALAPALESASEPREPGVGTEEKSLLLAKLGRGR